MRLIIWSILPRTVGAVYDRAFFVEFAKGERSQTAPTASLPMNACAIIASRVVCGAIEGGPMRFLLSTLLLAALAAQSSNAPTEPARTVVGRLNLDRYKSHIKGLTQFGDRMQGTDRNRAAIDWLEMQLRSFGY